MRHGSRWPMRVLVLGRVFDGREEVTTEKVTPGISVLSSFVLSVLKGQS